MKLSVIAFVIVYGFASGLRRAVESGAVLWEDYSNLS
jgi:hypothetical protein